MDWLRNLLFTLLLRSGCNHQYCRNQKKKKKKFSVVALMQLPNFLAITTVHYLKFTLLPQLSSSQSNVRNYSSVVLLLSSKAAT